jgi:hypothetical protein
MRGSLPGSQFQKNPYLKLIRCIESLSSYQGRIISHNPIEPYLVLLLIYESNYVATVE